MRNYNSESNKNVKHKGYTVYDWKLVYSLQKKLSLSIKGISS